MIHWIGCWFGDPHSTQQDLRAWVPDISEADVRAVDCQLRTRDLCRKLTELLYTKEDLAQGNATEARTSGIKLLDPHKLYAIRGKGKCDQCYIHYHLIFYRCAHSDLIPVYSSSSSLLIQISSRRGKGTCTSIEWQGRKGKVEVIKTE